MTPAAKKTGAKKTTTKKKPVESVCTCHGFGLCPHCRKEKESLEKTGTTKKKKNNKNPIEKISPARRTKLTAKRKPTRKKTPKSSRTKKKPASKAKTAAAKSTRAKANQETAGKDKLVRTLTSNQGGAIPAWKRVSAWHLRKLGLSVAEVCKTLDLAEPTVKKWEKVLDEAMPELPVVQQAIDTLQSLIPRALQRVIDTLEIKDANLSYLGYQAAKDILISTKGLTARHTVIEEKEVAELSDDDIVEEMSRIVAEAKGKS